MRPFFLCPLLLLALAGFFGCGSGPTRAEAGTRVDIPENGPEPGALEIQAVSYLDHMIELLAAPSEDPLETVRTLGRYLDQNREQMIETAQQVAARMAAMSPGDRIYYEERFSALFGAAYERWVEAVDAFRQVSPDAASRIDGLMIYFD